MMPPIVEGASEFRRLPDELAKFCPQVAMVLGSGLGSFIKDCEIFFEIPYSGIEGLPQPHVQGHEGKFVGAMLGGVRFLIAMGRVHYYEGYSPREVAAYTRLMASLDPQILFLTNAAGILNPSYATSEWMMLRDHINFTGVSPLMGTTKFVDMSEAYSSGLRSLFRTAAAGSGITLHEGIYACVTGPQYETPAEIRMLRTAGADAVGMSTAFEVIQARALDLPVVAFSCLTNWAAGIHEASLSHDEVMETGSLAAETLKKLTYEAIRNGFIGRTIS